MKRSNNFVRQNKPAILASLILTMLLGAAARAQTAAFTYQGRLSDQAAAANANYDFEFALYDAATGGSVIAATTKTNVAVTNGTFTVALDFGAAAFDGTARFLQIAVKRSSDPAGTAYTRLAPRQPVTSAPYAIQSVNAANAVNATNATNAATATDATQLGGVAAANYLQQNGSGANLTNLNAGSVASGTLDDARLSPNVARRNSANTFTGNQTINGDLSQIGNIADLNLTNGFVARGAFGSGAIPATGAGARLMFYPGKAAFRAGQVDGSQWDDANVGIGSFALGSSATASGAGSFAFGEYVRATGERAFAFGRNAVAGFIPNVNETPANVTDAIAIGSNAQATGNDSTALGPSSIANGIASVAIGPSVARGSFAVAIGLQNTAKGNFSVSLGKNASDCSDKDCNNASYTGVISISDACAGFSSERVIASANNQINIRGCGGFRFFTNRELTSGVQLASGAGAWSSISDRNMKENFAAVNSRDILRKVLTLPISTWNYKTQPASIRHIGAMAQDFKAAFEVGEDDKRISTIDPDGVAFAAIQGVHAELEEGFKERDAKIEAQQKQLSEQQKQLSELKKIVCATQPSAEICKTEDK